MIIASRAESSHMIDLIGEIPCHKSENLRTLPLAQVARTRSLRPKGILIDVIQSFFCRRSSCDVIDAPFVLTRSYDYMSSHIYSYL